MQAVAAERVLLPGGRWGGPSTVRFDEGRIVEVVEGMAPGVVPVSVLTPGLLDLHNNGAFGVDAATADAAGWALFLHGLARRGVTAVQPTIITAPLGAMLAAAGRVTSVPGGARVLGVHLEGPFLSPARRGAHREDWVSDPAAEAVEQVLAQAQVRTVTVAPERPGALAAIRRLSAAGILVALGHSDATADEARAGVDAGATMVTHLFNAMRPMGHREPGLVGVALTDPRLFVGLIVDGRHVDPVACRVAFAAASGRVVAVTDSVVVAGLPAGSAGVFGGGLVTLDDVGVARRPDGVMAGAGIVLDEGVRLMVAAGVAPEVVLRAATETAAAAIGRADLGRIARGARADMVVWDGQWRPRRVWVDGVERADGG